MDKHQNLQSGGVVQVGDIALISIRPEFVEEGGGAVLEEAEDGEVAGVNG